MVVRMSSSSGLWRADFSSCLDTDTVCDLWNSFDLTGSNQKIFWDLGSYVTEVHMEMLPFLPRASLPVK